MSDMADATAQTRGIDVHAALRRFLLAYERLDASWRVKFQLDSDEKLVILHLFEESIATVDAIASIDVPHDTLPRVLDRLERDGFIRRIAPADAVALTKKGLRARLEFDMVTGEMCEAVGDVGGVGDFLRRAEDVASARVAAIADEEQRDG